jgi:cytochrome c oxidase subunit IV
MTTPPRGEADEPPPIRETGVGWPDQPPPPRPEPLPPPPKPAPPRRPAVSASPDPSFAEAVQKYRAGSSHSSRSPLPYRTIPQRPGSVTGAAVILFVSAGLALLACCGINALAGEADLNDSDQDLLLVYSAVLVVVSLLNILFGYHILQGRQWARVTTIVLCALGIVGSVVSLFIAAGGEASSSDGLSTCFGIVLNVVIIILLSGERASDYFRYARG